MTPSPPSPLELHRRLIYSLLRPVVRMARRFRVPLKGVVELARLAYFEELRREGGSTQNGIADDLGVSRRTVATLEAQHKSDFLAPERELEFARAVEHSLADTPESAAEVAARLDDRGGDDVEVQRVLDALAASGRAAATGGGPGDDSRRYALNRGFRSLVRNDLHARIDGLNQILDVVTSAVRGRLAGDDPRPTVARTLSLVGTAKAVDGLARDLVHTLRHRCTDAEEESLNDGGTDRYAVTLVLAPLDGDRR